MCGAYNEYSAALRKRFSTILRDSQHAQEPRAQSPDPRLRHAGPREARSHTKQASEGSEDTTANEPSFHCHHGAQQWGICYTVSVSKQETF